MPRFALISSPSSPEFTQRRLNHEQNIYHQYLRDVKEWQAAREKQVNDYQEAEQQRVSDALVF